MPQNLMSYTEVSVQHPKDGIIASRSRRGNPDGYLLINAKSFGLLRSVSNDGGVVNNK
jgi:hypothetical protein